MTERDKKAWLDLVIVLIIGIYSLLAPAVFPSIFKSFQNFAVFTIAWLAGWILVGYINSLYPLGGVAEPLDQEKMKVRRQQFIERGLKLFIILILVICASILLFSPYYRVETIMWGTYLIGGWILGWLSYRLFLRKRFYS